MDNFKKGKYVIFATVVIFVLLFLLACMQIIPLEFLRYSLVVVIVAFEACLFYILYSREKKLSGRISKQTKITLSLFVFIGLYNVINLFIPVGKTKNIITLVYLLLLMIYIIWMFNRTKKLEHTLKKESEELEARYSKLHEEFEHTLDSPENDNQGADVR